MLLISEKLHSMCGRRGGFSSVLSEIVDHRIFFCGKTDEESVLFCLYTAVSNNLSSVSCVMFCTASLQCCPAARRIWEEQPYFSESQVQCRSWGSPKQPCCSNEGTVNRAQQVPAVARNMRKAEHGRRKKRVWLTIIVLSVHIWGIHRLADCFLAKGFCMINDAALCQEDNAAKHTLVSKQAETWSCATGMFYASPRVTIKPWVHVMWHRVITNLSQNKLWFISPAFASVKRKKSSHPVFPT